jgi:hypothetical protein
MSMFFHDINKIKYLSMCISIVEEPPKFFLGRKVIGGMEEEDVCIYI